MPPWKLWTFKLSQNTVRNVRIKKKKVIKFVENGFQSCVFMNHRKTGKMSNQKFARKDSEYSTINEDDST